MSSEEPSTANHSPTKPALLHNGILLGSNRISGAPLPNIFLLGMEGDILVPLLQLIEVNNLPHPDRRRETRGMGSWEETHSTFESSLSVYPSFYLAADDDATVGRKGTPLAFLLNLTNVVLFCAWHLRQQGPQPVTRRSDPS